MCIFIERELSEKKKLLKINEDVCDEKFCVQQKQVLTENNAVMICEFKASN